MKQTIVLIIAIIGIFSPSFLRADQNDINFILSTHNSELGRDRQLFEEDIKSEYSLIAEGFIKIYQVFISSQDKSACIFTVSCSNFTISAIQKYGLVNGLLMASDRLQRCNGVGGVYYPHDPNSKLAIDFPLNSYYLFSKKEDFDY